MAISVTNLLKELITIPSVSGNEAKVGDYIFELLCKNNLDVKKVAVGQSNFNVIAKVGTPKVYFSAHMDTVPPHIDFSEDDANIYGRGACDTKGCIASMLMAGIAAKKQNLSNFGLMFTVQEETDFAGVLKQVATYSPFPFVVVGEPTSLDIVNAHFGIVTLSLITLGKAAHSSRPEEGENAIDKLVSCINKINSDLHLHPESLLSIVQISGGIASNIIPAEAKALLSFRIAPTDTSNYQKIISELIGDVGSISIDLSIPSAFCEVPTELDFIKTRRTVRYCTELSYFKNGVVLGPGDIKFAHGTDEFIAKSELQTAVSVYTQIIQAFQK